MARLQLRLLLAAAALACARASQMALMGYLCPTCPSAPDPAALVRDLHPRYTHVVFAFVGWDATGAIVNQWDAPDKGFTLTKAMVQGLQAKGVKVLMSLGGGAGNILVGPPPAGFADKLLEGVSGVVSDFGLSGIDFDLENFQGDPTSSFDAVLSVVAGLKQRFPGLLITGAPQMTDVYGDYPQVTAGFNRYAPFVESAFFDAHVDLLSPQMYNTWGAVETAEYAQTYAAQLQQGFQITTAAASADGAAAAGNSSAAAAEVVLLEESAVVRRLRAGTQGTLPSASSSASASYSVKIPGSKLLLGFPASPKAAGSGYLAPSTVVAAVQSLAAKGHRVAGLMTWSIGWDQQAGWQFAGALAEAGL